MSVGVSSLKVVSQLSTHDNAKIRFQAYVIGSY